MCNITQKQIMQKSFTEILEPLDFTETANKVVEIAI